MTDRPEVSLRPFEPGDAAAVHRWFNNPEATADADGAARRLLARRKPRPGSGGRWTTRARTASTRSSSRATTEPVGFTALYGLFRQTAPELGALIGDDVRGKGVGRRAEALTIAKAFDEFGAHRVYGRIPARNEVAKKTVTGLGWKHEGTMRGHLRRADARRRLRGLGRAPRRVPRRRRGPAARERADRQRRADRRPRRGRGERGVLPLAPLPRRRGRHPHAADRGRRRRAARAADRPRDRRRRRARRDLPLRLPGLVRSRASGLRPRCRRGQSRLRRSTRPRSTSRRPASSRSSSATRSASRRSPAPAERNVVQIADPALPPKSRASDRNQINKNRARRLRGRARPRPETTAAQRAGFLAAYEQTMRRTGAAERYFFGAAYFDRILESDRDLARPRPRARRRESPPPRSPSAATASSTTTSAAAPTPTCATRR